MAGVATGLGIDQNQVRHRTSRQTVSAAVLKRFASTPMLSRFAVPIAAAFAGIAALVGGPASGHDIYEGLTNPQGERCCGGKECAPLADDDVEEVTGGFLIRSIGIVVPYAATQPSPDRRFHACIWWTP